MILSELSQDDASYTEIISYFERDRNCCICACCLFLYLVHDKTYKRGQCHIKENGKYGFQHPCPIRRTDEIGVLAGSLNELSQRLSATLLELQEANQKLQEDIDMERRLEHQRIEFFRQLHMN